MAGIIAPPPLQMSTYKHRRIRTLADWLVPKCSVQNLKLGVDGRHLRVEPDLQDVVLGRHRVRNRTAKVL